MSPVELSQSTGARPDRFALQNPRARFANRPLGCRALATSLLVALAALGARSRYWRMVPSSGAGGARAPSFLSRLHALATERVRLLPSPQDRADGFVGPSALLGSLSDSLSGALSGGLNGRLNGGLSGGLGGGLGKWLPPERSPRGSVGMTLGEPCRQPSGWQRARRPARWPAWRPARAVFSAAAPAAAAASRRISQAASLRPSALSAAGVFREGWAAACPAA